MHTATYFSLGNLKVKIALEIYLLKRAIHSTELQHGNAKYKWLIKTDG